MLSILQNKLENEDPKPTIVSLFQEGVFEEVFDTWIKHKENDVIPNQQQPLIL